FTFFLAFIGVGWAVLSFPKHVKNAYLFVIVWTAATLYLASSAARFLFIASPGFALMSAWILVLIIQRIDFGSMKKDVKISGGGWRGVRKGVKAKHIVGALFLVFMILVPNTWYAVDSGIPYETKPDYDLKIYNVMPGMLQPETYDEENGSIWYLGAFGYSMPIQSATWQRASVWPDLWEKLAERDSELEPEDRPAFVSWWDYGFEAIQDGEHPSVADNFQYGFQYAGNVLMCQGEEEAISLFIVRMIENIYGEGFEPEVRQVLREYVGPENATLLERINENPEDYVDFVLSDPERFGPRTLDVNELTPDNMKYTYQKTIIMENTEDDEELVNFYRDIREATGFDIRYMAVDSRLFPFSAQNTGIFYAPATLSDHRISEGMARTPYDFYEM
ncbi:MAG: peptide transporter, partial [Thermoplasmata archaeon]|nr:peptide transporter [Thermoplasmata archaeon]